MVLVLDQMNQLFEFYKWTLTRSDKRTDDWLFVKGGCGQVVAISIIYVTFVTFVGPKLMKNRQPFKLKWPILFYNVFCVGLNLNIFTELVYNTTMVGYSYVCQGVDYSDNKHEVRILKALWWYYFSKFIEMLDTVFFVLRKKNNQVSFLHVYHHTSMFCFGWICTKWFAGGQAFFGAILNSFVHVLMYTYYGIAGLGPEYQKYIWWKRYMTIVQLIQFIVGLTHAINSLIIGCPDYHMFPQLLGPVYAFSILLLFLNFYIQAYIKPKVQKNTNGVENGLQHGKSRTESKKIN